MNDELKWKMHEARSNIEIRFEIDGIVLTERAEFHGPLPRVGETLSLREDDAVFRVTGIRYHYAYGVYVFRELYCVTVSVEAAY